MDLFTERLVAKKWEPKDFAMSALCIVIAILISAITFVFAGFAGIIVTAAALYFAYDIISGILFVEYEYTLTNEELNIDMVIAKRKRKELKTYNIKEFTEGGKYDGRKALMLCPYKGSDNLYYLEKKDGATTECVVIDPNETMLKAFSLYMGKNFRR